MQNAGLTIGMVAIGLGLASIGFNSRETAHAAHLSMPTDSARSFVGLAAWNGQLMVLDSSGELFQASLGKNPDHPDVRPFINAKKKLERELQGRLSQRDRRDLEQKLKEIEAGLSDAMGVDGWTLRLQPPR